MINIFSSQVLMICYRGNQISQTGKGEWKYYTKSLIIINGFVTEAQYHGEIDTLEEKVAVKQNYINYFDII